MMKKTKPQKNDQSHNIGVGNIHHVSGSITIAGGDINNKNEKIFIHYDANAQIVANALTDALEKTKKRPKTTRIQKTNIEKEVKEIESEIGKKKINQGFLAERFHNIAKMAPDILDVIVTSLGNPINGIGMIMKKIAEKAKAEAEKEVGK